MKNFSVSALSLILLCCCPSFSLAKNLFLQDDESLKIIEKVYLHVDRDKYSPGDDIWFKAYLVDAAERTLSNHSYNLHVELISPSLKILDSRVVKLTDGLGNGDFHLADNLISGQYQIRAYTNYMRNFGDQLFFRKVISIINVHDTSRAEPGHAAYIKDKIEVSFFPEGGSLVEGVESVVAFKAVNVFGAGCDVTGIVYSSEGDSIVRFNTSHKGMGTFSFIPVRGVTLYAVVEHQGIRSSATEIPGCFPTGIALSVAKNSANNLALTFRTNPETLPDIKDRDLTLTVSICNQPIKSYSIRMNSMNSFFNLPVDDLPDGIAMLTLSDQENKPICERLVFIQKNDGMKVHLRADKDNYNQRDPVSLKITLPGQSGIQQNAFLSLSAFNDVSSDGKSKYPSTISSWFLLESDIRGEVDDPSYYFDLSNPQRLKDLDLLLLTQGWRDFTWKYEKMIYQPEDGFTISGKVRKKFADVPLKNAKVNLAIFKGGNPLIKTVQTDSSGNFYLNVMDLAGEAMIVASAIGNNEKLDGWIILDSIKNRPADVQSMFLLKNNAANSGKTTVNQSADSNQLKNEYIIKYTQYAEIIKSTEKKYKLSDTIHPGEVMITAKHQDAVESARSRSQRYLMTLFPDDELTITPQSEIFSNLGRLLAFKFHLRGGAFSSSSMANPIAMIDGLDVGWEGISYLPVDWIERVDYLKAGSPAANMFGERGKDGVFSVITKTGVSADTYTHVYHSVNFKFSGYNEPRIFYSPKHHTTLEADYKPDLRTTLFWEPNIKLENEKEVVLKYFNGDNPAKIKVIVEGITSAGTPVTATTEYIVK